MNRTKDPLRCTRCNEVLNPARAKWLELSQTDGNYYADIPSGHISQGGFSFGSACAKAQLQETATTSGQQS